MLEQNMNSTELQRAAKAYAEMGLAIFPLKPGGKTPLTKNGLYDASSDPAQIQDWWTRHPEANIGLVTGRKNGLLAIDLDFDEAKGLNGADSLRDWQRDNGVFPMSWRTVTGRNGNHLFYKVNEPYKNRVGILPGVDVRADGGYIVAPPSKHPNGNYYRWEISPEDAPLAELTDTVKAFLQIGAEKQSDAKKLVVPDKVVEGNRNDTMFRIACSMQAKGLSDEAIFAACQQENLRKFIPPLEEQEITSIVSSCTRSFKKGKLIFFDAAGKAMQGRREPQFQFTEQGHIRQTIANCEEAIAFDPQLYGHIRYNQIAYAGYVTGALPWDPNPENDREWTNFDDSGLKSYIESVYGLKNGSKCMDALDNVLHANQFNPITDRLTEIWKNKWDGQTGHIRKLLPVYLGAEDSEYTYETMKLFMLGAVCRAFFDNVKFDYTPIAVGAQGIGKSAFLRFLAMESSWFDDNFNTVEGDKASERLRGRWIVELAELLAVKKTRDQESIKAFLTSTVDTYRVPYGRRTEQRPRRCVFFGTTNSRQFLADPTGARRFLPIETSLERRKMAAMDHTKEITEDVLQAWGETMSIFMAAEMHPVLKMPEELMEYTLSKQEDHTEDNPWIGMIQRWLDESARGPVCAAMIFRDALGRDDQWTRREINEIHQIMEQNIKGWKRAPVKMRCGSYGTQVCYLKDSSFSEEDTADLPF